MTKEEIKKLAEELKEKIYAKLNKEHAVAFLVGFVLGAIIF